MARWKRYLRLAVGALILGLLVARADFRSLTIRWSPKVAAGTVATLILLYSAQAAAALRWKVLLGAGSPRWRHLFRLYLVAAFFSLFLPTSVGGDTVRAYAATQTGAPPGRAIASVLLDRMLGVLALGIFLAAGLALAQPAGLKLELPFHPSGRAFLSALFAVALLLALGWIWRRRLRVVIDVARQMGHATVELARAPTRLASAVALGLVVQGFYLLAWLSLSIALDLGVPAASVLVTVPVVSLSAMMPITLSGVGLREGAWILLLAPYGVSSANALAYSLLYFACWMIVSGSGGVLFALKGTGTAVPSSLDSSAPAPSPPSQAGQASPGLK